MKNKHAQEMAKLSHKKSPRSKEFMAEIGRKGGNKKAENRKKRAVDNSVDS